MTDHPGATSRLRWAVASSVVVGLAVAVIGASFILAKTGPRMSWTLIVRLDEGRSVTLPFGVKGTREDLRGRLEEIVSRFYEAPPGPKLYPRFSVRCETTSDSYEGDSVRHEKVTIDGSPMGIRRNESSAAYEFVLGDALGPWYLVEVQPTCEALVPTLVEDLLYDVADHARWLGEPILVGESPHVRRNVMDLPRVEIDVPGRF